MEGAPAIDESKLSPEELTFYQKYGRLPPAAGGKNLLNQRLKGGDRKYFDSGDYALSKAGKTNPSDIGTLGHPSPERIPHSVPHKDGPAFHPPKQESNLANSATNAPAPSAE